ncbi:unnamed protein product [Brassicogethes aeneus]|uniref:Regulatory protein zeste n=1 Tax=Brassicogethes aeneus TaxID=1431903 RepID=A0A9P0BGD7_BRAAE|nr:unnamed protein product [Brassicogethes aeneus]
MDKQGDGEGPSKKRRVVTFQPAERICLVDLVQKYFQVVECKKTDACSSKAKWQQWNVIAEEFNSKAIYIARETQALKTAWENMKKKAKSIITKENQNRLATGGGPLPVPEKGDAAVEKIITLLRPVVQGLENDLDSDNVYGITSEDIIEETDRVNEMALDKHDSSNVLLVDSVEGNSAVEVELSGDWSYYTTSMLRAPRSNILQSISAPAPLADSQDCNNSTAPQPSGNLTPRHNNAKANRGTRHLGGSSRRRPFLKQPEAERLAQEKLKILACTTEQATEEHNIMIRILLLQEEQEKEKLKHEKLKTFQEQVKLQQEKLKLTLLEQKENEVLS